MTLIAVGAKMYSGQRNSRKGTEMVSRRVLIVDGNNWQIAPVYHPLLYGRVLLKVLKVFVRYTKVGFV